MIGAWLSISKVVHALWWALNGMREAAVQSVSKIGCWF